MEALETGISPQRGPVGEPGEVVRLPVTLLTVNGRSICVSSLTLWELCDGILEGGLLYWERRKQP
jgi:hypothetical protein